MLSDPPEEISQGEEFGEGGVKKATIIEKKNRAQF